MVRQGREWRVLDDDTGEDVSLMHPDLVTAAEHASGHWQTVAERAPGPGPAEAAQRRRPWSSRRGADEDLKALGYVGR
jgi:hypothetical protein